MCKRYSYPLVQQAVIRFLLAPSGFYLLRLVFTCSVCGDSYTGNGTQALGHSYKASTTSGSCTSGEEFVIFDGGQHGYDNMFCDEHDPAQLKHRPLKRYEIPASKLVLEPGYNIDYEDEKEDFVVDEADTVELVNGGRMPWEQVKRDGIDYIALYYVNVKEKRVQILDAELA